MEVLCRRKATDLQLDVEVFELGMRHDDGFRDHKR
jgi:hypothetical protein